MKICIVTVYDSINSGSYWQAYVLGHFLERAGHKVFYFERQKSHGASSSKKAQIKYVTKLFLSQGACTALRYVKMIKAFQEKQYHFMIAKNSASVMKQMDCFVLGSDTIWNLDSNYFFKHYNIFWGGCFSDKPVMTYAASAANTSKQKCKMIDALPNIVQNWEHIGVRDEHTKEVIEMMTSKQINIVCDPTFLLEKKDYESIIDNIPEHKYIFLYLFNALTKPQISEIVQYAKMNDLKIIHGAGFYSAPYCDEIIVNSPDNFLRYMLGAEYVVTDTFHGMAFSINFRKQFVALNKGKNKVNEFLERIGFEDRLVGDETELVPRLITEIDYKNRMDQFNVLRENSIQYLLNAINELDKEKYDK